MATTEPKQKERRPPRNTEEQRDSFGQVKKQLLAGKITVKEARSHIKAAQKRLQQARRDIGLR